MPRTVFVTHGAAMTTFLKHLRDWLTDERPARPVLTNDDPRCRAVLARQKWERRRLKREGIGVPRVRVSSAWAHDPKAMRFLRADR